MSWKIARISQYYFTHRIVLVSLPPSPLSGQFKLWPFFFSPKITLRKWFNLLPEILVTSYRVRWMISMTLNLQTDNFVMETFEPRSKGRLELQASNWLITLLNKKKKKKIIIEKKNHVIISHCSGMCNLIRLINIFTINIVNYLTKWSSGECALEAGAYFPSDETLFLVRNRKWELYSNLQSLSVTCKSKITWFKLIIEQKPNFIYFFCNFKNYSYK